MRVLSIDAGILAIGFSVLDDYKLFDYGIFGAKSGSSIQSRLESIRIQFMAMLHKYKPDVVVIEEFFPSKFSGSNVSKAIGVIMVCCESFGIESHLYSPQALKKKVRDNLPPPEKLPRRKKGDPPRKKISKKITKKQVGDYVNKRLGTNFNLPDSKSHITDSIGHAILYLDGEKPLDL